jgi:hypothetical protein
MSEVIRSPQNGHLDVLAPLMTIWPYGLSQYGHREVGSAHETWNEFPQEHSATVPPSMLPKQILQVLSVLLSSKSLVDFLAIFFSLYDFSRKILPSLDFRKTLAVMAKRRTIERASR